MRLITRFCRLPVIFDAVRLRTEIGDLGSGTWRRDPDVENLEFLPIIGVGDGQTDRIDNVTQPTLCINQLQYVRQVLSSFGVAWSSLQLLKLGAGVRGADRVDVDSPWSNSVSVLFPIVTGLSVIIRFGEESANIQGGEAWVLDNWQSYSVENGAMEECVFLLARTPGDKAFWELVAKAESGSDWLIEHRFCSGWEPADLLTERALHPNVLHPADLERCITHLLHNIVVPTMEHNAGQLTRLRETLLGLCHDWQHVYAMHGSDAPGWESLFCLIDKVLPVARHLAQGLIVLNNGVDVSCILERLLVLAINLGATGTREPPHTGEVQALSKPVFIISAPRSGSTLLFETLATHSRVCTIGPDTPWLLDGLLRLAPGASQIDSNRLDAEQATHAVKNWVVGQILRNVRNSCGDRVAIDATMKFLEKTPRNCLRVPFINHLFPDARFIYLWRDPRETISSMIDQWHAKGHVTYKKLGGFDRPWCFMIPPGWRAVSGKSVEEIAAYQWDCANKIALNDLLVVPRERLAVVRYSDLIDSPKKVVTKLCRFTDLDLDKALAVRLESPLPLSRTTASDPKHGKWRRHEEAIHRILPQVASTWSQLKALTTI